MPFFQRGYEKFLVHEWVKNGNLDTWVTSCKLLILQALPVVYLGTVKLRLDGRSYREKYEIPRTQPLAAKEITSRRQEVVQRSRPWEKAPTFLKAQERAQKAVVQKTKQAQRKGAATSKA
jgi:hypothetical protein